MASAGNWCLIESDPGVFTELIKGFGVQGAQVEELYCLEPETFEHLKPVHGLVFLFKWVADQEIDGSFVYDQRSEEIVFMRQVIENSCATQALLSILLNCNHEDLNLGENLTNFKSFISSFDAETKGFCLSNNDTIREVHNSFSRQQLIEIDDRAAQKEEDAFHFVAYLPIKGRIYELDGLKDAPIDLGEIPPGIDWTVAIKPILERRMQRYSTGEIRFNLMAVVSDRKIFYEKELSKLLCDTSIDPMEKTIQAKEYESLIQEEERKRITNKKENIRRKHNYLPFIVEVFKALAQKGQLVDLIQKSRRQKM